MKFLLLPSHLDTTGIGSVKKFKIQQFWAKEGVVPCFESPNLEVDNCLNSNMQPPFLSMKSGQIVNFWLFLVI